MKLGDIKVGTEYAIGQKHGDPRQVKALEVVEVIDQHGTYDHITETWKAKKERKIKVKYLDAPTRAYEPAKGATGVVSTRDIHAPWAKVGPGIQARKKEAAELEAFEGAIELRAKKLLGRGADARVSGGIKYPRFTIYGAKHIEKLLSWAEKGKAVTS